ncbi:hypothetical protein L3X38_017436 [Prunus dulcis]|uniref:Uncharacterized protein n=1 Tax=Prunus dulcis TaxID=3755 RepID=A0AAD4W745_PRUDU|nr:hypothetical protein L3X38_017436 [Prunus dulcis]
MPSFTRWKQAFFSTSYYQLETSSLQHFLLPTGNNQFMVPNFIYWKIACSRAYFSPLKIGWFQHLSLPIGNIEKPSLSINWHSWLNQRTPIFLQPTLPHSAATSIPAAINPLQQPPYHFPFLYSTAASIPVAIPVIPELS